MRQKISYDKENVNKELQMFYIFLTDTQNSIKKKNNLECALLVMKQNQTNSSNLTSII